MSEAISDGSMMVINEDIIDNGFTMDNDPETGLESYFCKQCDYKTTTQKGVKIHLGAKHKSQGIKRANPIENQGEAEEKKV